MTIIITFVPQSKKSGQIWLLATTYKKNAKTAHFLSFFDMTVYI